MVDLIVLNSLASLLCFFIVVLLVFSLCHWAKCCDIGFKTLFEACIWFVGLC